MRLTMKPGVSTAHAPASCPSAWRRRTPPSPRPAIGLGAADHLDQLHQRHRVEEVHADERPGRLQAVGERRDRDRGGVGGEDAVGADQASSSRNRRALGVGVLDDRLDHQAQPAASASRVAARSRAATPSPVCGELALGDQASRSPPSLAQAACGGAGARVEQPHRVPGLAATWAMPAPMVPAPTTKHRRARIRAR